MKELRAEMGLTQQECASLAEMPPRRWQDIEAGRFGDVGCDTLHRIARALGCDTHDDLLPTLAVLEPVEGEPKPTAKKRATKRSATEK